jgi:molecular chaperone GrpE
MSEPERQNMTEAPMVENKAAAGESNPEAFTVAQLQEALAAAEAKASEQFENFLRAKAEADNARRRAQEDVSKAHKFGIERFAESLVPVKDSLEAALAIQSATLESYKEGMEITLRQLVTAFERNALVEIAPTGQKFDPHRHQAIAMVPSDAEANTVVAVMQKGYMIADRVLRPALVSVSQGKPA